VGRLNQWLTVVANFGVLVGIFFLTLELRQNSRIALTSEYRENAQGIADFRTTIVGDPELSRIQFLLASGRGDELTPLDLWRWQYLQSNLFGTYEAAFVAWRNGVLDDDDWSRYRDGLCGNYRRLQALNDGEFVGFQATAAFRTYLQTDCGAQ